MSNYSKGSGKGDYGKGSFSGKCFKCGETGHRKQDCTKVGAVDGEQEDVPTMSVESVWTIGEVAVMKDDWQTQKSTKKKRKTNLSVAAKGCVENRSRSLNQFIVLQESEENLECQICQVDGRAMTREARMDFNEADVRAPLASAMRVARAGNGIWLDGDGGFIQNMKTREKMEVRIENGVYVIDVELDDGTVDVVTLDSGAGCSVWPKGRHAGTAKMQPKKAGVGMVAANGTPIAHYGQRQVCFRGVKASSPDFTGRM